MTRRVHLPKLPSWTWAIVGFGLDTVSAFVGFVSAGMTKEKGSTFVTFFSMLLVAVWVVHVLVLPTLYGHHNKNLTWSGVALRGAGFLFFATFLAPAIGMMAGAFGAVCLSPLFFVHARLIPIAWIAGSVLIGAVVGGAATGDLLAAMRPNNGTSIAPGPWRRRSDVQGGALAAVGLWAIFLAVSAGTDLGLIGELAAAKLIIPESSYLIFALAAATTLLPHLLLLGLDLRHPASAARPVPPQA